MTTSLADPARPVTGPAGVAVADPHDAPVHPVLAATTVFAVLAGVVLRFFTDSPLWLDEALSVNVATLPLGDIGEALRHDGHPPLFYWLLHGWTEIFGSGDAAARSLSGLFGVACLPVAWLAGRRFGGRTVACYTVILVALSPFATRYATEARMYSMVTFLVLLGYVLVRRSLEAPTPGRLVAVGAVSAAIVLTHYWSFYLLIATAALLARTAYRHPEQRSANLRTLIALGIGSLAFLPWAGSFLYQLAHTGTPWSRPIEPFDAVFDTLLDFGGGKWIGGRLLAPLLAALLVLAVFGRVVDRHRVELDLRTRPEARPEIVLGGLTLAIGVGAAVLASSAYQPRYAAVFFPFVMLVAAFGITRIPHPVVRSVVVALVVVAGLAGAVRTGVDDRTQGEVIANRIAEGARPGDVVGYCPDQLAPAVNRALPAGFEEITYPGGNDGIAPRRVEWVDYIDRIEGEDPEAYARQLVDRAGSGTIWMVWAENYPGFDERCEAIVTELEALGRDGELLEDTKPRFYERANLSRFEAAG